MQIVINDFIDTFIISTLTYFLPVVNDFVNQKDKTKIFRLLAKLSKVARKEKNHFGTLLETSKMLWTNILIQYFLSWKTFEPSSA